MKQLLNLLFFAFLLVNCSSPTQKSIGILVSNEAELKDAISKAKPGDDIVMANGVWTDIELRLIGSGTEEQPITLRAEEAGKVSIEGKSDLKLGGNHLVVSGLLFKNGYSPSRSVIQFKINNDTIANHCRVTNCVIDSYNKSQRNKSDLWVLFHGRHNQLDHCYLAGKSNRGPTVRVDLEGNESINNYHKISNNHFGPRPPKGGPSAETIQIGNSYTSMAPSYTLVNDNFFEYCNGEVEVISSKTNFNEFRNNVFYKSEGSLVTRHGNYCIIDGNYFIGDEGSENIGGVRLIGTGHWVTNNYFYKLKGKNFRSPLAVMNGIRKSPLNRYIQVTDVVVAYNTWIDCVSPLQFGVGSNVDQKDVLPASEIRSERPIRTIVANNLLYNTSGDPNPIVAHDKLDGINFQSNLINNQGVEFSDVDGLEAMKYSMSAFNGILVPDTEFGNTPIYKGFEFDKIATDIFGSSRAKHNAIGAISIKPMADPEILNPSKYGADWYSPNSANSDPITHQVNSVDELRNTLSKAKDGDVLELADGNYKLKTPVKINKSLTIQSRDESNKTTTLTYEGESESPLFEMNPNGHLILKNVSLRGNGTQYAFASLKENMSSLYNLTVENCDISNFDYILKAYKYSFSENITLTSSTFTRCNNGIELSEETEDKGEYNAENIIIKDCQFYGIKENVIDYYRGGYDESTVGGTLVITGSTFSNSGGSEKNGILINTYGIINVNIYDNKFINNKVKHVAMLWGAKNNYHSDNTITNSGKITVEENLKLNLLY